MKRKAVSLLVVWSLLPAAVHAQSLTGLRIDGPSEVLEGTETLYKVYAEFDNGWEFEVTLDCYLWVEPGTSAEIGVFGDFHAFQVEEDAVETINAYYSFGDESAMAALDVTVLNFPLAGFALDYDGANDYVLVPGSESLAYPGCGGWTVEAWVFPRQVSPSLRTPMVGQLSIGLSGRDPYKIEVFGGQVSFQVADITGAEDRIATPIAQDQWTHVAGVYDSVRGVMTLYLNGSAMVSATTDRIMESSSDYTVIFGGQSDGPRQYNGLIDEVRIWNVARGSCDIFVNMDHSLRGDEEGLVGYWRFDEGGGQYALDSSPHGNDGRLGHSEDGGGDTADPLWEMSWAGVDFEPFEAPYWTTPQMIEEVSSGEEWKVAISADGLEMYIESERGGVEETDIYRSVRSSLTEPFSTPVVVEEVSIPGYRNHEGPCALSGDGLRLYLQRHYWQDPGDLFVAARTALDAPWGEPTLIYSLSEVSDERSVGVTGDELEAVFTSDRSGEMRCWHATRASIAEPWGDPVLVESLEGFIPSNGTFSGDGLTLYVTAEGPTGLGGYDLWKLTRPCLGASFSGAVHVPTLSSPYEEYWASTSPDGGTLYIVRQEESGAGNVYVSSHIMPEGPLVGGLDCDGDMDVDDYGVFADCLTGPEGGLLPGCDAADYDIDADVDLVDYQLFLALFGGG
jgi:hypothetical protein